MGTNSMGQYRYSGSGLTTEIPVTIDYKTIATNTSAPTDSASFKDIVIIPNGGFVQNTDYHIKLTVPRDMNYSMNFDLQLIKSGSNADSTYQFIRNITLEQGGDNKNVYTVVLYESIDGKTIKAMIPLDYKANVEGIMDNIYMSKITTNNTISYKYYICRGGTNYEEWSKINKIYAVASWKQESSGTYGVFDLTFRPIDQGFTQLLLRMVRTAEDYNIQNTVVENGKRITQYGRVLPLKKGSTDPTETVTCELQTMTDIVPQLTKYPKIGLSRIGVWGHPGLLMIINGEEIRIPLNGYYELDAIPITSLGIAVPPNSYDNFFTIDYEYEIPEG